MRQTLWTGVTIVLLGCGSRGTAPEDMSAAEHRQASREHHTTGDEVDRRPPTPLAGRAGVGPVDHDGASHHRLAAQHQAAADTLDAQLREACAGVAETEQRRCPWSHSSSVEDVEGGARMRVAAGSTAAEVESQARCHRARMMVDGLDHMTSCPFGVRGLVITARPVAGGAVDLVLTTTNADQVTELRRRARTPVAEH
ncbi:MAG: hypothetical protein IT379_13170 [Deltaproteobacteria bacterium]|nr:hypothetical protein [Deltaproteobacteria bacterium]